MTSRLRLRVRGTVQGVGFRPFVYGLATRLGLTGWICNDSAGVLIEAQGAAALALAAAIRAEAPPLARIDALESESVALVDGERGFAILASRRDGAVSTLVGADGAVCAECLAELFDPAARRYRYPFLNCTRCGPRYTITRRLPYDRPQTAMAGFSLCGACAGEYHDPADRRFHAQPIACPACGPRLSMAIEELLARLRGGEIVALKGLGGFHLVCDAANPRVVEALRRRKERDGKPFAVMVANVMSAARLARLEAAEAALLSSSGRPIVLLHRHPPGSGRGGDAPMPVPAAGVAPDLAWLGVMLPYTPLHYLLFHEAAGRPAGTGWLGETQPLVLVMTSANPGGEPLVIGNAEARTRLAGIADAIVDHDRDIVVRCDDSVLRLAAGGPVVLRRGRGQVPTTIRLKDSLPTVLGLGGQLKGAVCVIRDDEACLSQHLGDLDRPATLGFLEESVDHLLGLLEVTPEAIAHDGHPDFATTRLSVRLAERWGVPALAVQHHHAHVAAVAAEHGLALPVIGLALDGFGLGDDGGAWGGEALLLTADGGARRLGHLAPLALPGGDRAALAPWRMAAAALHRLAAQCRSPAREGEYRDALRALVARNAGDGAVTPFLTMLERGVACPPSSALGRWFDAACGLLGVRPTAGFEGEAPMVLESLVSRPTVDASGWVIDGHQLDLLPLLDRLRKCTPAAGADLFHGTLAAALVAWTVPLLQAHALARIVLAGGCLANRPLLEGLVERFAAVGVLAVTARSVPAGDGGLALGQAWVAAQHIEKKGGPGGPVRPPSWGDRGAKAPRRIVQPVPRA